MAQMVKTHGRTETKRDTGGGGERGHTGRQTDRALSPEGAPPVQQGWGGGAPAGRQLRSRGHQEGMVGGWRNPLVPSSPACCPCARTGGPGGDSVPPSAWEHHREDTQDALPFCAGLKKSPAAFPQTLGTPPAPGSQHRERVAGWTQNDGEADRRSPGPPRAPWGRRGREGRGWAGGDITDGQDSRRGHRHAPPLPWGQARGSVSLPSSPLGAQELGAPQPTAGMGRRAAPGEEGGTG